MSGGSAPGVSCLSAAPRRAAAQRDRRRPQHSLGDGGPGRKRLHGDARAFLLLTGGSLEFQEVPEARVRLSESYP